MQYADHRFN